MRLKLRQKQPVSVSQLMILMEQVFPGQQVTLEPRLKTSTTELSQQFVNPQEELNVELQGKRRAINVLSMQFFQVTLRVNGISIIKFELLTIELGETNNKLTDMRRPYQANVNRYKVRVKLYIPFHSIIHQWDHKVFQKKLFPKRE